MSIAADIRAYAQRSLRSLIFERDTMTRLEHALCESFLTPCDWEEHSLWSIEWRTFALFVAEARLAVLTRLLNRISPPLA